MKITKTRIGRNKKVYTPSSISTDKRIRIDIGFETANRRYDHSVRMANREPRYTFCRLHLNLGTISSCVTGDTSIFTKEMK
ncbi:hypothetical protein PRIPAC_81124 [Pristionchus pacificus]|nr:hypothetical protein PRIPAC_81124 [Pristionchus pacificus]|eukprot:PDM70904.1 hypothetical protein PRIPAC_44300 [Pristionchus pacificus]